MRVWADAEDIGEGRAGDVLRALAPALEALGVTLGPISDLRAVDDTYVLRIGGEDHLMWQPGEDAWTLPTERLLALVNGKLADAGVVERVYASGGGNDQQFALLAEPPLTKVARRRTSHEAAKRTKREPPEVSEASLSAAIDTFDEPTKTAVREAGALLAQLTELDAAEPPEPTRLEGRMRTLYLELLAKWAMQRDRYDVAIASFLRLFDLETEALSRAFTMSDLSTAYFFVQRHDDSRRAYERAIALLDECRAEAGFYGKIQRDYGASCTAREDYAEAITVLEKSLRSIEEDGADEEVIGSVECDLAVALLGAGRVDESKRMLDRARTRLGRIPAYVRNLLEWHGPASRAPQE